MFLGAIAGVALVCLSVIPLSSCGGSSTSITIAIQPTPGQVFKCTGSGALTCPLDSGATINFVASVGGDPKNQGVCWALPGMKTPCGTPSATATGCAGTGTTAASCGALSNTAPFSVTYTAPPSISSSITVTLTAFSVTQHAATQTVTITVELAPTFSGPCASTPTTCPLPNAANGVAYSETLTITGGVAPYTYSVSGGSLPACLNLNGLANSTTTTITGTPCSSGLSNFTVQVLDQGGLTITQAFSLQVTPPPPLSISTTNLPQGLTNEQYSAFIVASGGVAPLKWSLPGGGNVPIPQNPQLVLNGATGQISGVPTTTGTFSFQIQVTDSSLPAPGQKAGPTTVSITIQNPPPLIISTSALPSGNVATGYAASLQATGGLPPYSWTITQGLLPSGLNFASLNDGTGKISGTPVLATTATFTVQVTDSEVVPATRPATFTLTINAGTANPNSLFSGSYAFLFNGFDTDPQTKMVGSVAIAGTLTADGNGNITAGEEDSNRLSGIFNGTVLTGTYTIGTDGRGHMNLTAVNSQGTTLNTLYDLVLDSSGNIRFFEDNTLPDPGDPNNVANNNRDISGTHGMGILKPMVGSTFNAASLSGNYAFEFVGQDSTGGKEALAGVVQADGNGSFGPGGGGPNGDFNDAGTYSSPPPSISGNFSVGTMSSRGGASFLFQPATKSATTLSFVFYFISPTDLYFVEDDVPGTVFPNPPRLSGEMILQQPSFAFNQNALAGSSVATGSGVDGSNASVFAGLISSTACDGVTPVNFSYDQNDGGTLTAPSFTSATCTVQSNGRVVFTGFGTSGERAATAFLTGPGQGFLFGSDTAVTTGFLDQQSGGPFSLLSTEGGYTLGAPHPAEALVNNFVGQVVSPTGNGSMLGTIDEFDAPATATPEGVANLDQALSATINSVAANGRGTITSNPLHGFPVNIIFYQVSPSAMRAISADPGDANPQVITFDH